MKIKTSWRLINICIVLFFSLNTLLAYYFLSQICLSVGDCQTYTRREVWRPLMTASIIAVLTLTPFIFLPTHYFSSYFKKIFWWLALVFYVSVIATERGSDIWLDRTDIVYIMGAIGAVITLAFILVHYWLGRSKKIQQPPV
jgi:hypothetical protein